jgi:hypothetical protein
MPNYSLTEMQKCALARLYIAYFAVCTVYGCGKICRVEGKEKLTLKEYLKLCKAFIKREGVLFENFDENLLNDVTEDELVQYKKKKADTESIKYSANQVWEMGMKARKELLPVVAAQTLRW